MDRLGLKAGVQNVYSTNFSTLLSLARSRVLPGCRCLTVIRKNFSDRPRVYTDFTWAELRGGTGRPKRIGVFILPAVNLSVGGQNAEFYSDGGTSGKLSLG
jgi:hypothetical protein